MFSRHSSIHSSYSHSSFTCSLHLFGIRPHSVSHSGGQASFMFHLLGPPHLVSRQAPSNGCFATGREASSLLGRRPTLPSSGLGLATWLPSGLASPTPRRQVWREASLLWGSGQALTACRVVFCFVLLVTWFLISFSTRSSYFISFVIMLVAFILHHPRSSDDSVFTSSLLLFCYVHSFINGSCHPSKSSFLRLVSLTFTINSVVHAFTLASPMVASLLIFQIQWRACKLGVLD